MMEKLQNKIAGNKKVQNENRNYSESKGQRHFKKID